MRRGTAYHKLLPGAGGIPSRASTPRSCWFGMHRGSTRYAIHRYRLDEDGTIMEAKIVPPTSQNQASIEDDLREFAGTWLDMPDETLRLRCEQAVRNHDPCISCATHFLKLEVVRA